MRKLGEVFFQKEEASEEKINKRYKFIYIILGSIVLIEMGMLYYNSSIVSGLNADSDQYKEAAIVECDLKTIAHGDICDRNGELLAWAELEGRAFKTVYADDYAYSQVLGYTSPKKYVKGLIQISTEDTKKYRLMEFYRDELYTTVDVDGRKGQSLQLTLDHKLQMKAKELLLQKMTVDERGSVLVLNAKTGEILAMVSFPSFHVNDLNQGINKLNNSDRKLEMRYPITHKGMEEPGSVFKIVTLTSQIDHGLEAFTVIDSDYELEGKKIVNSYKPVGDEIGYRTAMIRSSNVFFSKAALALGGDALTETAKKFMIGEEIALDFGTIDSNWNLTGSQINLAHTGFGQGHSLYCTLTAGMTGMAIANDGIMMKPYLVQSVLDGDGKKLTPSENSKWSGKPEILSNVTSKETADKVTNAMRAAVLESYVPKLSADAAEIYRKYEIAGKTGTAETGNEDDALNNAWFLSFAPMEDPQYVVVVNQCDTRSSGRDMMDTAAGIYQYLFEEYK